MVKGSPLRHKGRGTSLILECEKDSLSESQIKNRKRKLEDICLLQAALQAFSGSRIDLSVLNGTSPLSSITSMQDVSNSNGSPANQAQFLQYMLSNNTVSGGSNQVTTPNQKNGTISVAKNVIAPNKGSFQPIQPKKPTLTQSLRATRKTTGRLPPPKVDLANIDDEPEIEVIKDSRPSPNMQPPFTPTISNTRTATGPNKPVNNALLLNISVRARNIAHANAALRKELDMKVKNVLMKTPSEFVEWLLSQGLIRSQQYCSIHKSANRVPTKLKLGMFSDPKILTTSGGYVWIGECCGRKYVSVYSGSLFGATPIDKVSPTSLLKLVYHWSCQTSISNVETWVKVDKSYISKIYHYLRCICSVILHDKIFEFGVTNTHVELGIVSLGTTTADGSRKAVKVEILGLYDRKTKSYRLFASTPEPGNTSRERFLRILKPVNQVVNINAIIICDQSVDPTCLSYKNVEICKTSDDENDPKSNSTIMFYLRKHVPKMFQAALSQLTERQVQLILDELCWREKYASSAASCYDNMLANTFYITSKEMENPGVLPLLEYVSENPHNNWRYKKQGVVAPLPTMPQSVILANSNGVPNVIPSQYSENFTPNPVLHSNKVMTNITVEARKVTYTPTRISTPTSVRHILPANDKMPATFQRTGDYKDLEPYFYGYLDGNSNLGNEENSVVFKCHLCTDTFQNDNIAFYCHLKLHAEMKPTDAGKLDTVCPYCTMTFESVHAVDKHKVDVHLMSDLTQVWCRICAEKFQNEHMLKTHMMRKHVEAELPYRCEVCHYATSFYYDILNHFNTAHKGSPYVQCHYCLAVKSITPGGEASFSNRMYQHIMKHAQKLQCRNCLLTFYSKHFQTEHRKEHLSCANIKEVVRYESPKGYRVLQFRPNIRSMPIPTAIADQACLPAKGQAAISLSLEDQTNIIMEFTEENLCMECDSKLESGNHFKRYRKCTKCPYTTSCDPMMFKHSEIFHPYGLAKLPYVIGRSVKLPYHISCQCGFSTQSGHHMAHHLALCKQTTAYPPEEIETPVTPNVLKFDMEEDFDEEMPALPLSVELSED